MHCRPRITLFCFEQSPSKHSCTLKLRLRRMVLSVAALTENPGGQGRGFAFKALGAMRGYGLCASTMPNPPLLRHALAGRNSSNSSGQPGSHDRRRPQPALVGNRLSVRTAEWITDLDQPSGRAFARMECALRAVGMTCSGSRTARIAARSRSNDRPAAARPAPPSPMPAAQRPSRRAGSCGLVALLGPDRFLAPVRSRTGLSDSFRSDRSSPGGCVPFAELTAATGRSLRSSQS
jgi:hypothetical protein